MARRWPPPTYELTSEEGFPHERTFSIACTIGNTREIGECCCLGPEEEGHEWVRLCSLAVVHTRIRYSAALVAKFCFHSYLFDAPLWLYLKAVVDVTKQAQRAESINVMTIVSKLYTYNDNMGLPGYHLCQHVATFDESLVN